MRKGDFGTHLNEFVVDVLDRYLICLITASPYDQVGILEIFCLFYWRCSLDQSYSLLIAITNSLVHSLGIASESCKRVQEAILVREVYLFVVCVSIRLSLVHSTVENSDPVTVQYCNVTRVKRGQIVIVKAPICIPEKTVALADAGTWPFPLFFGPIVTHAAPRTVLDCANRRARKLKLTRVFLHVLHGGCDMSVMQNIRGSIEQDPCR